MLLSYDEWPIPVELMQILQMLVVCLPEVLTGLQTPAQQSVVSTRHVPIAQAASTV